MDLPFDPFANFPLLVKTIVKVFHLLGIVLGLGAATVLDLLIIRFVLAKKITADRVAVIEFASKIVVVGLAVLWLSGICFLIQYSHYDPEKLTNPKIWAKIVIVGILTINGIGIHWFVLPLIRSRAGYTLFEDLQRSKRSILLIFGTVSAISWYVPLLLGAIPYFNFVVPAGMLLIGYCASLIAALAIIRWISSILFKGQFNGSRGLSWPSSVVGTSLAMIIIGVYFFAPQMPNDFAQSTSQDLEGVTNPRKAVVQHAIPQSEEHQPNQEIRSAIHDVRIVPIVHVSAVLPSASNETIARAPDTLDPQQDQSLLAPFAPNRDLSHPTDVKIIQQRLADLGYLSAAATGSWGRLSRAALRDFKTAYGLPTDNSWDQLTEQQLFTIDGPRTSFLGVWAVEGSRCSMQNGEEDLPAVISDSGARAGDVTCNFSKGQRADNKWKVKASCSRNGENWTSDVTLVVSGNRLRWSSSRGFQNYTRCNRPLILAAIGR